MMKRLLMMMLVLALLCPALALGEAVSEAPAPPSGFNPDTNYTVTLVGLVFSLPVYFDTEDEYLEKMKGDSVSPGTKATWASVFARMNSGAHWGILTSRFPAS